MPFLFTLYNASVSVAYAAADGIPTGVKPNASKANQPFFTAGGSLTDSVRSLVTGNAVDMVINIASIAAGAIAIFFLILAGLQYITSQGDPKKVEAARGRIVAAIIGIVIITAAYTIVRLGVGLGRSLEQVNIGG